VPDRQAVPFLLNYPKPSAVTPAELAGIGAEDENTVPLRFGERHGIFFGERVGIYTKMSVPILIFAPIYGILMSRSKSTERNGIT
jgi:hypothetical protein